MKKGERAFIFFMNLFENFEWWDFYLWLRVRCTLRSLLDSSLSPHLRHSSRDCSGWVRLTWLSWAACDANAFGQNRHWQTTSLNDWWQQSEWNLARVCGNLEGLFSGVLPQMRAQNARSCEAFVAEWTLVRSFPWMDPEVFVQTGRLWKCFALKWKTQIIHINATSG